jgi:hypothetical protein
LEALKEAGPTFRFRTWASKPTEQYPDPKVNHEWRGVCNWDGDATEGAVEDDTEEQPQWESDAAAEEAVVEEAAEESVEEAAEEIDFEALGKLADSKDKKKAKEAQEATRVLAGHAKLLDIDHESFETWGEVAEAIANHEESEEVEEEVEEELEEEDEEEEWVPQEGESVYYTPPGKKEPISCEVVKVEYDKASIRRSDTKKLVKVPLEKLSNTETPF